jgi:RHS repeat-associated protein
VNGITWLFDQDSHRLAAKIVNGTTYSVINDHVGTPQWMYDSSGKKVWEGVLDIYGRIRTLCGSGSDLPFRYQGQYEDVETGLYYNRFRYYNPDEGMYISQDPIRLHSGQPNFYAYVHDPNIWVDVFGLFELFRSMSRAEYYDIKANGWKEGGGATMSGKWFAESAEHATQWGYTMGHGTDTKFYVVKVEVPDHIADAAFKNPHLDGIGAARYLEVVDLNEHGKLTEVTSVRVEHKIKCG